jgi:mycofactocin precursor peptide peptidase
VNATRLGDLAWPEVGRHAEAGTILAVPLGATEQHGPHLALSTDTEIAVALCQRLAADRGDVLVAPAVPYGSSGEHAGFAGTLSIGQAALELLVIELVRSATQTFGAVVLVSAHGGNAEPLARAVAQLRSESRDVSLFAPRWNGDPHAGRVETSLMLALRPALVKMQHAAPGDVRPIAQTMNLLRAEGVMAVSASGVLGDPTGATTAEGQELLDTLADQLIREVAGWRAAA